MHALVTLLALGSVLHHVDVTLGQTVCECLLIRSVRISARQAGRYRSMVISATLLALTLWPCPRPTVTVNGTWR